jgi:hypothetical protein
MTSTVLDVTIAADAAASATIDLRPYTAGVLRMPSVWTAASLAFLVNEENSEQTVMQTAIAGEATAFTQPGAATALEILQDADVAGDRGRGIVIEGSDADGVAISETITLDATNTTTVVAGTTEFTKISGVYTADGLPLGAQDVTIRETDNTEVCTLAKATSELGADIPAQATRVTAGADTMVLAGPNTDETYVTLVGTLDGETVRERVKFDGGSPAAAHTNTRFDTLTRICLGEFTNAGAGSVKSRDPWVPLYHYGDLVSLTVAANEVMPLPAELSGVRYVRLWSQTAGSAVVQEAERHIVVSLKSAPAPQLLFAAAAS